MKKFLGTVLILSLLGGSAAVAAPYNYDRGYSRGGNNGALVAGVGLFALAAILATQNRGPAYGYQERYDHRDYDRDGYRGGYGDRGQDRDGRGR